MKQLIPQRVLRYLPLWVVKLYWRRHVQGFWREQAKSLAAIQRAKEILKDATAEHRCDLAIEILDRENMVEHNGFYCERWWSKR